MSPAASRVFWAALIIAHLWYPLAASVASSPFLRYLSIAMGIFWALVALLVALTDWLDRRFDTSVWTDWRAPGDHADKS